MSLSFEEVKKAAAAAEATVDVEVEHWGGSVRLAKLGAVAGVSIGQRYDAAAKDAHGYPSEDRELVEFYVLLVSHSIVEADGKRRFTSEEGRDLLRRQPIEVLRTIGQAALKLNGYLKEDADAKKN